MTVTPLVKNSNKIGLSRSLQSDKIIPIKETKNVIPLKEDKVKRLSHKIALIFRYQSQLGCPVYPHFYSKVYKCGGSYNPLSQV